MSSFSPPLPSSPHLLPLFHHLSPVFNPSSPPPLTGVGVEGERKREIMRKKSTTAIFLGGSGGEMFVLRDGVLAAVIGSNLCGRAGGGRQWEDETRLHNTKGPDEPLFLFLLILLLLLHLFAACFRSSAVIFVFCVPVSG